jgi:hypothetical protein
MKFGGKARSAGPSAIDYGLLAVLIAIVTMAGATAAGFSLPRPVPVPNGTLSGTR